MEQCRSYAYIIATRGRSCSALVEDFSGQLDIIYWQPIYEQRQLERARLARAPSAAPATAGAEAEEGAAAGASPAAHSHEEPPAVGPATAPLGQGDKQVSGVWRLCIVSKHWADVRGECQHATGTLRCRQGVREQTYQCRSLQPPASGDTQTLPRLLDAGVTWRARGAGGGSGAAHYDRFQRAQQAARQPGAPGGARQPRALTAAPCFQR